MSMHSCIDYDKKPLKKLVEEYHTLQTLALNSIQVSLVANCVLLMWNCFLKRTTSGKQTELSMGAVRTNLHNENKSNYISHIPISAQPSSHMKR